MKAKLLKYNKVELLIMGGVLTMIYQPVLNSRYGLRTIRKDLGVSPVYARIYYSE